MFTGIIETTSVVRNTAQKKRIREVTFAKPTSWKLKEGQSVNVNGICSTVVESSTKEFVVEYMPETLRKTTARSYVKGMKVNLERSLKRGDRMDGHVVQGHVDGTATVETRKKEGRSLLLTVRVKGAAAKYIVPGGSIALDGVSLTIAKRHGPHVTVALVPHTLTKTTLGNLKVGDTMNVESDVMMRRARV